MNNAFDMGYGNHGMMTRSFPNMVFSTGQAELANPGTIELRTTTLPAPTIKPATPTKVK